MLLSCSTNACPHLRLPEALEFVTKAGFQRVQLSRTSTESSPVHPDFSVRQVREHLRNAGVQLTGLHIRDLTGRKADSNERNLAYNRNQIEWDIHLARALGLKSVNLHGGARTDEALQDLIEGLQQLLERIPDITVNLASRKESRVQGLEDYQAVLPHVGDRAKVLLDTGNLLDAGEDVLKVAEALAERIGLVHLRHQRGDKPVPSGVGDMPFEELLKLLRKIGYHGILVIELEKVEWDDPLRAVMAAREYLENLVANL